MRAWMYQLNPDKGQFWDGRRWVPTTVENLFRVALPGRAAFPLVEEWTVSQFFRDAKKGDPLLLRSGGSERLGVVACGRIEAAERDNLSFRLDRLASNTLRSNPIAYDWIKRLVPASRANLVKLEPYWPKIAAELAKRGVHFGEEAEGVEPVEFETLEPLTEEGRRYVVAHVRVERRNRGRVLASRPKPYRCEACGFNFGEAFGAEFADYIQVHHQVPVSSGVRTPRHEEFALLCANCHVIAHWKQPNAPLALETVRALRSAGSVATSRSASANRDAPPIDLTPGSLGLFVFRLKEGDEASSIRDALNSVLDSVADARSGNDRVLISAGEVHQALPQLSHLLLSPPGFLVGVDLAGAARSRAFDAWQRIAPSTALCAGAVNAGPEQLGLPPRIQIRGDTLVMAEEDKQLFATWAKKRGISIQAEPAERFAMGMATGIDPEELEEIGIL